MFLQPGIMTRNCVEMKNSCPDISVITVNYNGLEDTCELIDSLQRYLHTDYEIIVIDNGSSANEAKFLEEHYPGIIVLRSEKNLGFAGGNNLGIRQARGRYLLFLNNDTYITDDSLHFLIETARLQPATGAVGPKIKFAFPPQHIQFAGYTALSPITLRNRLIGYDEEDHGQYDQAATTPYLHGAAMLVKREVIEKTGEMPDIYFLYYEELDWCTQMTRQGYELRYDPRATVYHRESRSTGIDSPLKTYYLSRNRLLYTWRQREGMQRWISLFYQWCLANPKNITLFLLRGKYRQAAAVIKGCFAFLAIKNKKAK